MTKKPKILHLYGQNRLMDREKDRPDLRGGARPNTGGARPGTGGARPNTGGSRPNTGGSRPGAGAPKKANKKKTYSFTLSPEVAEAFKQKHKRKTSSTIQQFMEDDLKK